MRVLITGGTGLVGRAVARRLIARGDEAVILTRRAEATRGLPDLAGARLVQGEPAIRGDWERSLAEVDAVVHLAGQPVFGARWSDAVRRAIRDSRIEGTRQLVAALGASDPRPRVLISASAIGYYGPRGDEALDEDATPGEDFLACVCRDWEAEAQHAADLGMRVVRTRIGIVLDPRDGALALMLPVFRYVPGGAAPIGSAGGVFGRGQQWMSWIHRDDVARLLLHALDTEALSGPLNVTAPEPARNADFSRALARVLRRPFVPVGPPDLALRLLLGEAAAIITRGQRVLPARAQASGFHFEHPGLPEALEHLLGSPRG